MGFLIFGASGFLGSRITDWLEDKNESITLGTNSPFIKKYKCIRNYLNLDDAQLEKIIRNFHTIYDASGIGINQDKYSLNDYLEKNAIWPSRLAKVCIKANTRLIWLSTIHCEKYEENSNDYDKYSLSKLIGEQLIKTNPDWKKYILIIRLGNIIGAPGKLYRGKSSLFVMDIASNLVKNNRAIIKSNTDLEINTTSLNSFLNYINQINYGQKKFCSSSKFKLTDLANCIKNNYESITNMNSNIYFKGQILNSKKDLEIPEKTNADIRELIKFYLTKELI